MRKWVCGVLAVLCLVTLAACSKQEEKTKTQTVDLQALADALLKDGGFQDDLEKTTDEMVKKLYQIEDAKQAMVYVGSGATAEEIGLFELKDEDAAKEAEKLAKDRIENQKTAFESYVPEEVKRLDNAIVQRTGNYVIVVVAEKNCQDIIDSYVK